MIFLLGIIGLFFVNIVAGLDYDGRIQLRLDHDFSDSLNEQYVYRGDALINTLQNDVVDIGQTSFTTGEIEDLKKLAHNNPNANYKLKTTVKTPDGKHTVFYSFASVCALLESEFQDNIFLHFDHNVNVVGVSLTTQAPCTGSGIYPDKLKEITIRTQIYLRSMEIGPVPDTASYIQKIEREREAKDRGETKDNRSFLAKYWMYIVPVVIIVLISSASNPEAGGGQ